MNAKNNTKHYFAVALLCLAPLAMAQTPDGETPAEETVCDPLKEDGVTKGLYGLCVAFCEAQDHVDISSPITEEELEALADAIPSGRILSNFNKKKDKANNPADPDMPCIKVQEPCPCWTEEEFLTASQAAYDSVSNSNTCSDNYFDRGTLHSIGNRGPLRNMVYVAENSGTSECLLRINFDGTNGIQRLLGVTPEELGACRDRIKARQDEFELIPSSTVRKPYCYDSSL